MLLTSIFIIYILLFDLLNDCNFNKQKTTQILVSLLVGHQHLAV